MCPYNKNKLTNKSVKCFVRKFFFVGLKHSYVFFLSTQKNKESFFYIYNQY